MEHLRIIRDVEMKNVKPVYMLMGEEPYFVDLIADYIEEHVLDEATRAFCQVIVYGRDTTMEQVVSLAKGFPMMGDRQVIIVREAQDMREWKKADDMGVLEHYLQNPTPSTVLVFACKKKKIDKRLKVSKLISSIGVMFESTPIKEYKLPEWISDYVRTKGMTIQDSAARLMAEYLGADLGKVVNEISKLAIVLPAGTAITPQHIETNIGISKDYNVWELQKALASKDVLKSNRIIDYFESNPKDNPIQKVLPALFNFFARTAVYEAIPDKRQAATEMGVQDWTLNESREAVKNYSRAKLERIIGYLRDADRRSKGVDNLSVSDGDLMKELVFKILH